MADERRPSPPARGPRNRPTGSRTPNAPLTGPLVVDAATNDALRLFNARLGAQAENEKAERRVQKAAKAKDDAAGRVRNLENDTKASAEQRAEATAAYRAAVEAWERARSGEPEPATSRATKDETVTDEPVADETLNEEAVADEPVTDEPVDVPAAEEPASEHDADATDPVAAADAPVEDVSGAADSADATDGAVTSDH